MQYFPNYFTTGRRTTRVLLVCDFRPPSPRGGNESLSEHESYFCSASAAAAAASAAQFPEQLARPTAVPPGAWLSAGPPTQTCPHYHPPAPTWPPHSTSSEDHQQIVLSSWKLALCGVSPANVLKADLGGAEGALNMTPIIQIYHLLFSLQAMLLIMLFPPRLPPHPLPTTLVACVSARC